MSDPQDLKIKIEHALAEDPETRRFPVDVLVRNEVVVLAGTVDSRQAKESVEAVVIGVDEVGSVINELDVVPPPEEGRLEHPATTLAAATRDQEKPEK